MPDHEHNPLGRRDAELSRPEVVREPLAPALQRPQAGSRDGSVTSGLPTALDDRDASPVAICEITEEGETEGDGVERETLDAGDEPRIERPFDPSTIRIAAREPSVETVMERIQRGEIELAPDFPPILLLRDDARLRPHSAGAMGRAGEQADSRRAMTPKSRQG